MNIPRTCWARWSSLLRPTATSSPVRPLRSTAEPTIPEHAAYRPLQCPGMRYSLKCHPDSPCAAATHINLDVARPRASSLLLSYTVAGKIGDLLMPAVTAPARIDELWRHTCFEAFIRATPDGSYFEFNFAPSTQWAAYRF